MLNVHQVNPTVVEMENEVIKLFSSSKVDEFEVLRRSKTNILSKLPNNETLQLIDVKWS